MERLELIERTLEAVLPSASGRPSVLHEAMRYAVGSGGKRLRPQICLAAAAAAGGRAEDALYPACAIELLHNYTLVHDDLPAMDNDRERRGQPTVWVKFGEANAILAGDALLALAYQTAAKAPRNAAAIVAALGEAGVGVVRGQVEDLRRTTAAASPASGLTPSDIDFLYRHKTADLFIAAAKMGALAADAAPEVVEALGAYALELGLAFQFEDDLLDGDSPYPETETRRLVIEHTASAVAALAPLPGDTSFLKNLAETLVGRQV